MDTDPCPWEIPVKWWQWWNFLLLYIPIRPALHSAGGCRGDSLPSCVCYPSQQYWGNLQAVLLHLKVSSEWSPVCADSWIVDDWLWNCSQVCRERVLSKRNHPGCFFHPTPCVWRTADHRISGWQFSSTCASCRPPSYTKSMYGSRPWRTINDDNTAAFVSFNDYVTETWIEGHFEFWNHFDHDGPRTTNAV